MRIRIAPPPATSRKTTRPSRQVLRLELLEERKVPAVAIQIDYSFDSNGFFNDAARRAVLQQALTDVASHLTANLPGLTPGSGNTWSVSFFSPANGGQTAVSNPTLGANTLLVYAGGRDLSGSEAGAGGYGGFSATGTQTWLDAIQSRGPGFALWGGSLAFDTNGTNWYIGSSIGGIAAGQVDFYSVAVHEFGHILGVGTSQAWFNRVSGGRFVGTTAQAVYGGTVPLNGTAHWADGVAVGGQPASLDPVLQAASRVGFSSLDFAALRDIGWSVAGIAGVPSDGTSPPAAPPPPASPPPPPAAPVNPVPLGSPLLQLTVVPGDHGNGCTCSTCRLAIFTGPTDGAQLFEYGSDGRFTPLGPRFQPFPGFAGVVRSTIADFNGDRIADFAFATGAGAGTAVRIISGATGTDLVGSIGLFEGFSGGLFLAAGDVDRDGKAELAISADAGGGTRISLLRVGPNRLDTVVDFLAFGDAAFRGGSRVAMGDVNRDGIADAIVGAGLGGGPRVAVYDGASLVAGRIAKLVPDFFALDPNLRGGVFVTAADFDGDGFADLAYSIGHTGGPRVRIVGGSILMANPGADAAQLPAIADFFAWNEHDREGLRLTARDLDADGRAELIAASGSTTAAYVRVIPLNHMTVPTTSLQHPFADPLTIDGVYVG